MSKSFWRDWRDFKREFHKEWIWSGGGRSLGAYFSLNSPEESHQEVDKKTECLQLISPLTPFTIHNWRYFFFSNFCFFLFRMRLETRRNVDENHFNLLTCVTSYTLNSNTQKIPSFDWILIKILSSSSLFLAVAKTMVCFIWRWWIDVCCWWSRKFSRNLNIFQSHTRDFYLIIKKKSVNEESGNNWKIIFQIKKFLFFVILSFYFFSISSLKRYHKPVLICRMWLR